MSIAVEIADRLYDYTDEEAAAAVVADFQQGLGLTDEDIVALWSNYSDSRRSTLEKLIFDAVDANGSVKRASENVPAGIELSIETVGV